MPTNLTEEDARALYNGLGSLSGDDLNESSALLESYAKAREDNGLPLWTDDSRQRAETIRNYYVRPDNGLPAEKAAALQSAFSSSLNPEETKARTFNGEFLSHVFGADPDSMSESVHDAMREAYASKTWGTGKITDSQFFAKQKETYALEEQLAKSAVESALTGSPSEQAFAKWSGESTASTAYNPANVGSYRDAFTKTYEHMKNELSRLKPVADRVFQTLQTATSDADLRQAIPLMDALNDTDAALVMQLIDMKGKAGGDEKGFALQSGEALYRSIRDVWSKSQAFTDKGTLTALDGNVGGWTPDDVIAKGPSAILDRMVSNFNASRFSLLSQGAAGGTGEDMFSGQTGRMLTKDETEAVRAEIAKRIEESRSVQRMQRIADEIIDPVKGANWLTRNIYYPALQGSGVMVNAFMSGGSGLALNGLAYADDEYNRLRDMGVKHGDALTSSALVGSLQAAMDQVQASTLTDKLPGLKSLFNKPVFGAADTVKRFAGRAALDVGILTGVQQIKSEVVPPLVQTLAGQGQPVHWLSFKDEDGNSVDGVFAHAVKTFPEAAGSMLLLGLLGAGAATVNDVKGSREILSSTRLLKAYNLDDAQANEIRTASLTGDTEGAVKLFQKYAKPALDGGVSVHEAQTKALQSFVDDIQRRDKARKDLTSYLVEAPELSRVEGGWKLKFDDGSESQTFAKHEDADAAKWAHVQDVEGFSPIESDRNIWAAWESNSMNIGMAIRREFEFVPHTLEMATDKGLVGDATAKRRAEQDEALMNGTTIDQEYQKAAGISNAISETSDDAKAAYVVLGLNKVEFSERGATITTRFFSGGDQPGGIGQPIVSIEEDAETTAKILLNAGMEDWLKTALREYEAVTGDKLFRTSDDADLKKDDLVEAFSHFAQSVFMGSAMKEGSNVDVSSFRSTLKNLMGLRVNGLVTAMAHKYKSAFQRYAAIKEAMGKNENVADLHSLIANAFGLGGPHEYNNQLLRDAEQLHHDTTRAIQADQQGQGEGGTGGDATTSAVRDTGGVRGGDERMEDKEAPANAAAPLHGLPAKVKVPGHGERYSTQINGNALYDFAKDPLNLYPSGQDLVDRGYARFDQRAALTLYENAIKDAGFIGYASDAYNVAALFHPVPLKKEENSNVTLSLAPGDIEKRVAAMFDPLNKNPELRAKVVEEMKRRASVAAKDWENHLRSAAPPVSRQNLELMANGGARNETEAKMARERLAKLDELESEQALELGGARQDKSDKQAINEMRKRHALERSTLLNKWRDQDAVANSRESGLAALRTLDAITSALPADVRVKIGGVTDIASVKSDEAMLKAITDRATQIDDQLEKYLVKDFTDKIEKLFDRYGPKSDESGKKKVGKIGADEHDLLDTAKAAMDLTAQKTDGAIADLEKQISSGNLTAEEEALANRKIGLIQLFGDWKNADAARMSAAHDALKTTAEGGYYKWKLKQLLRKEDRDIARDELMDDAQAEKPNLGRSEQQEADKTLAGKARNFFYNLSSFPELLEKVYGRKSEKAKELADREREASYKFTDSMNSLADEIEALFTGMTGSVLEGEKLRFRMSQKTIDVPKDRLSEFEAMQALLMWRQPDGRRHMEGPRDENGKPTAWAYDQAWIDNVASQMSPEAKIVLGWISDTYAAEYGPLNALYRERFGINLPHYQDYAQLTVKPLQRSGSKMFDPETGGEISGTGFTPASLRSRSRSAVAEPEFRDALQTLLSHKRQINHWMAYYDFATDAKSILGNRDMDNTVEGTAGKEAVTTLGKWIDIFTQGGVRSAGDGLAYNRFLNNIVRRASTVALVGRVSTLVVQAVQVGAAAAHMPVGEFLFRFSKLISGRLPLADAWNSAFIQRRLAEMPPIVRQAMSQAASEKSPNRLGWLVQRLGSLINGADALFTAGTYAIIKDYNLKVADQMGLKGAEAEAWATKEAERLTETVAQPIRAGQRSLAEITSTAPLTRALWAFASESRQKASMLAWAVANAKNDPAYAAKVAFLTFGLGGTGAYALKGLWKRMKGDDPEDYWSPQRIALNSLMGPLQGVPGFTAMTDTGNMFSAFGQGAKGLKRLVDSDSEGDGLDVMKDVEAVLSAAGLFNEDAASLASLSHAGVDFAKLITHIVTGEPTTKK